MYVITGMHRSGTSIMSKLVFEAGIDMGNPETFYRADKWNPHGYYEQTDILSVNKRILHGVFWKFAYFRLPSHETILKRAEKNKDVICELAESYRGKTIKDPRFCLTMPAWQTHSDAIEKVLFCLRDPIQSANSIRRRNQVFTRHGLYLWYEHNKRLLDYTKNLPVWFIYYNNILRQDSYIDELKQAFRFLGCELSDEEIHRIAIKWIEPELNHHPETQYSYEAKVQDLWDTLRERHQAQFT